MTIPDRTLLVVVVSVLASGCGGTGSTTTDGGMLAPAYAGVFASVLGESGTIDFVVATPTTTAAEASLTGTLLIESMNGPITLSGTVDASGSYARFSGSAPGRAGTLDCYGSFFAAKFGGACTGDDFYRRFFTTAALGTEPFFRYCGTATGNALVNVVWNLFTSGGVVSGVFANGAVQGDMTGMLTAGNLSLVLSPVGSAMGQVSGSDVSGTWTIESLDGTLPPDKGTFLSSVGNCP